MCIYPTPLPGKGYDTYSWFKFSGFLLLDLPKTRGRIDRFMPSQGRYREAKHNQLRTGFERESLVPLSSTITVSVNSPPVYCNTAPIHPHDAGF